MNIIRIHILFQHTYSEFVHTYARKVIHSQDNDWTFQLRLPSFMTKDTCVLRSNHFHLLSIYFPLPIYRQKHNYNFNNVLMIILQVRFNFNFSLGHSNVHYSHIMKYIKMYLSIPFVHALAFT